MRSKPLQKRPRNNKNKVNEQALAKVTDNLDLINEILVRLSFKSSIRCMCVCKTWYALIKENHSKKHKRPQLSGLFCHIPSVPLSQYHYIPLSDGESDSLYTINPFQFMDFEYSRILQSCNGLLLLFNSFPVHRYYVYNTVTRQHWILPRFSCDSFVTSISLAFDPERPSQYKIVAFRRVLEGLSQVLVYSSECCTWRNACEAIEVDSDVSLLRDSVFWENSIIWVNCNFRMPSLRFKFDTEEFMTIPSPPIQHPYVKDCIYLKESEGHLYFVEFGCYPNNVNEFDVHELERDSLQWLLRYRVDLGDFYLAFHKVMDCNKFPFLISLIHGNSGEGFLLVLYVPGQIILYDLKNKIYTKLCDFAMDVDRLQYFQRWGQKCIHHHVMPVYYLSASKITGTITDWCGSQ